MMRNEIATGGKPQSNELMVNGASSLVQIRLDAKKYPRIKNMSYGDVIKALAEIVGTAFMYSGRKSDGQDIAFIATSLYQELMTDEQELGMASLTIAEIGRCVKRSVMGQGQEMFGISVASLYKIIAEYCKGEGHLVCKEIEKMSLDQRMQELKQSAVGALIDAAAGQMVKSHK